MKLAKYEIEAYIRYVYDNLIQADKIHLPVEVIDRLSQSYYSQSMISRPLAPHEQGIVTLTKPKSAALFADRVWSVGGTEDSDITFGWEVSRDVRWRAMFDLAYIDAQAHGKAGEIDNAPPNATPGFMRFLEDFAHDLAHEYRGGGAQVSPLYDSAKARDAEYRPGDQAAILAMIANVLVVDENELNWEQVCEFRRDADARSAYRMFIHWLDKEMVAKSSGFVADEIASRLEKYEWALHKHGIQTVIGGLERIINPGMLAATSAVSAGLQFITSQPVWSLMAAGGLLLGGAALSLSKILLDRADIDVGHREIAYVHKVKALVE